MIRVTDYYPTTGFHGYTGVTGPTGYCGHRDPIEESIPHEIPKFPKVKCSDGNWEKRGGYEK